MKCFDLNPWLLAGAIAVASVGASSLQAAIVNHPVVNASFEDPVLFPSSSWHGAVNGWNSTGAVGTTYALSWLEASPAPDGNQMVWGDSDNWQIFQSGPTLAANTRYLITMDLFPLSSGTSRVDLTVMDTSLFTQMDQLAFQPTWDPGREDFQFPAGQWTTVTMSFSTADFPTLVGNGSQVVLQGHRLAVDNVSITIDDTVHDFYISTTDGGPGNTGFSSASPFDSFTDLDPYFPLRPGERILLKRGDTFSEELNIRGKGTSGNLVELTAYGTGNNPIIRRSDTVYDYCIVWNNASHARISHIDAENAKLGLYLRYEWTDSGSQNVTVENCNFRDMPDPGLDSSMYNFEVAWSNAIFVGGQAWNTAEFSTRIDGLTIRNVTASNCAHLFGSGWYFPAVYMSRIKNLLIEDCWAFNNLMGSFSLINVDGGTIRRVNAIGGGGQDTWSGTTLGMIQSSKNVVIEDCEFAYIDRAQAGDGSGMDFEGNTENVTFRNNTIHNNDAAAILILSTQGPHTNLIIEDNTMYNNARDPWNSEINSEIQGSPDNHTGIIRNNGIYRGDPSINFFSPSANWSGFTLTNNRQLEYSTVKDRPTWWNFDTIGNFDGWGLFNQWNFASVSSGVLWGLSTGTDPFVHSPATFVSSALTPYAWVRMSQTSGSWAELFYITETDPIWDGTKRISFPITADGTQRDYFVDLDASANTNGVITQVRLDPTLSSGSNMAIDHVRLTDSTDLGQSPPAPSAAAPLGMVFTSIASEDGYVRESSQNSLVGGQRYRTSTTARLGDDSSNRAYRQFFSFDTSPLPDNAVITEATLGITRVGSITGSIPIGVSDSFYGALFVDYVQGTFGSSSLQTSDFQAAATGWGTSKFAWPAYSDGMTIYSRLEDADEGNINRVGRTQFRVRYENDDDNDGVADYVRYATSDHSNSAIHPTLTIKYVLP